MANDMILSNKHVGWFVGPDVLITDWIATPLEDLEALENYSGAIRIADTDFGLQATEMTDDRTFADEAGAQELGYNAFGGNISTKIPANSDNGSVLRKAHDTFKEPRTKLAVAQRFGLGESVPLAAGQEINLFRTITDSENDERRQTGYSMTTELVDQDDLLVNYIIPTAVPSAVTVGGPTATPTGAVGTVGQLDAFYQGHRVTVGVEWVSANPAIVEVYQHGGYLITGVGTAEITASYPGGTAGTISVQGTA